MCGKSERRGRLSRSGRTSFGSRPGETATEDGGVTCKKTQPLVGCVSFSPLQYISHGKIDFLYD